jgi:hypothetical protein
LEKQDNVLELLKSRILNGSGNVGPNIFQYLGLQKVYQSLLASHRVHTLRKALDSASGRIISTVVKARGIMLNMGCATAFVCRRKENAIHPQPKVFITDLAALLLVPIKVWK